MSDICRLSFACIHEKICYNYCIIKCKLSISLIVVQTIFSRTFGLFSAPNASLNMSVKGWVGLVHNIN